MIDLNYRPIQHKEIVTIEIKSEGEIMGTIKFDLKDINSQNEYHIDRLEINDRTNFSIGKISANLKFVWSFVKYYQDLINVTEKNLLKYDTTIKKSNSVLQILNGKPYNDVRRAI